MADIVWTDVTNFASELSDVNSDAQTLILQYVNETLNVEAFDGADGPKTKLARIYLAAHFGSVERNGGTSAGGPVSAERAGDLSISYGIVTMSTLDMARDSLLTTPYGKMYLMLVNTSPNARAPICL